jgi:hypothetical protein
VAGVTAAPAGEGPDRQVPGGADLPDLAPDRTLAHTEPGPVTTPGDGGASTDTGQESPVEAVVSGDVGETAPPLARAPGQDAAPGSGETAAAPGRRSAAGELVLPGEELAAGEEASAGPAAGVALAPIDPADERIRPVRLAATGGVLYRREDGAAKRVRVRDRNQIVHATDLLVAGSPGAWALLTRGVELVAAEGAVVWLGREPGGGRLLVGVEQGEVIATAVADAHKGGVVLLSPGRRFVLGAGRMAVAVTAPDAPAPATRALVLAGSAAVLRAGEERSLAAGRELVIAGGEATERRAGSTVRLERLSQRVRPARADLVRRSFERGAEGCAGEPITEGYRGRALALVADPSGGGAAATLSAERGLFPGAVGAEVRFAMRVHAAATVRIVAWNATTGAPYEATVEAPPPGRWAVLSVPVDELVPSPGTGARPIGADDLFTRLEIRTGRPDAGAAIDEVRVIVTR